MPPHPKEGHSVTVRAAELADFDDWAPLFRAYRAFYKLPEDEDVVRRVWGWIGSDHEVHGLVAVADGRIVGIAHYRRFARPCAPGTLSSLL